MVFMVYVKEKNKTEHLAGGTPVTLEIPSPPHSFGLWGIQGRERTRNAETAGTQAPERHGRGLCLPRSAGSVVAVLGFHAPWELHPRTPAATSAVSQAVSPPWLCSQVCTSRIFPFSYLADSQSFLRSELRCPQLRKPPLDSRSG